MQFDLTDEETTAIAPAGVIAEAAAQRPVIIGAGEVICRISLPRVQPIIPTWRKEPFDDPEWVFDLQYDGFRVLCYVERGRCWLISRNGNVLRRFDALGDQLATALHVDDASLDGEVFATDETGRPQFYDLIRRTRAPAYVAFDILWLNCRPALFAAARASAPPAEHSAGAIIDNLRGSVGRGQGPRALPVDARARSRGHRRQATGGSV